MNILHTSDWHLGRTLYTRKRYLEFDEFLLWLAKKIQQEQVDVLLVAGDVFDTNTPSHKSQELYYRFLCRIANSCCRHVVIIAGNHDSPSFLNAPKELLRFLNVHVIGSITEPQEEVIVLKNKEDHPELIVCATPYLRDRDIRTAETGESLDDKGRKLIEGVKSHYLEVCELAEKKRQTLKADIPIVSMGHLFTQGGQTVDGDGVRELYVGSLAHVTSQIFPDYIDYVALGHLHVPQKVNNSEVMRYSGSPLPMGYGESKQEKSVCFVSFEQRKATVSLIKIPVFQELERVKGSLGKISTRIQSLKTLKSKAWLEVVYDGEEVIGDLRQRLDAMVSNTEMEILRVKNNRIIQRVLNQTNQEETLDTLNETEVFERCLLAHDVPQEQHSELRQAYQEVLTSLREEDSQAE